MKTWTSQWLLGLALFLAGVLIWDTSRQNSATVDEVGHVVAGIAYWERGDFFVYHHSPPLIRLLLALPVMTARPTINYSRAIPGQDDRVEHLLGRDFMEANALRYHSLLSRARMVTLLFTLIGGLLLYRWGCQMHGTLGGVVAAGLWLTDPMVLAHGGLATTDVATAVVGLAGGYSLWRYLRKPSNGRWLAFCLLTGLGLLTKYTLLVFLPVSALALWLGRDKIHTRAWRLLVSFLFLTWLVLQTGYAGQDSFRPLGRFEFTSTGLSGQAAGITGNRFQDSALAGIPVPLPAEYLLGLDAQSADFERGWTSYLRGETRQYGWLGYYLYGFAVKSPLGSLLLLLVAAVVLAANRRRLSSHEHALLLLPIVLVHLSLALNTGMNHHIRYTLACFPYLCLAGAWLAPWSLSGAAWKRRLLGLALIINLIALARVHPQELAYFNPLVGGPARGHLHLADSNIDWGQDLLRLKEWQNRNPQATPLGLAYHSIVDPQLYGVQYYLAPPGPSGATPSARPGDGPQPGWYAVSVNQWLGLPFPLPDGKGGLKPLPPGAYTYFQHFQPVGRCGYGFFLFHLRPHDVARVRKSLKMPPLSSPPPMEGERLSKSTQELTKM